VLRRATIDDVGGFDERCPVNEDWDLFLRASRRGARWACVDEALCDYRIHPGQSHERLELVHGVARDILQRFFDDAALSEPIRRLEPRAWEEAELRAAAELYVAGATGAAEVAFGRAVRRRPSLVGEPRTMLRFLRLMLPDGRRSRAEVVRRRRELLASLASIVACTVRGPWEQGRATAALAVVSVRLESRAWLGVWKVPVVDHKG
jgi:hypothetical protein